MTASSSTTALCGAVDIDTFSDPQSPGGTRRVCELPAGHDGSHTAFSGPGHLPCYWWPQDEDQAEVARLRAENTALTGLLAAVAEHAQLPHPADVTDQRHLWAAVDRLAAIAVWADPAADCDPDIRAEVVDDRAAQLRKYADRPLRYEIREEAAQ